MSSLSGRFTQDPAARRRYLLDYTLSLSEGETVTAVAINSITQIAGLTTVVPLTIDGVIIGPGGLVVQFFASGGDDDTEFEVQFLATTSVGQIIPDTVQFNIESEL